MRGIASSGPRAVVVSASMLVAACSGPGGAASTTTSPGVTAPAITTTEPDAVGTTTDPTVPREPAIDPALVAIGDLLDDEGVLPLDAALALFATAVEPLPGVVPLDIGIDLPTDLGSVAVRRLTAARDEVDPTVMEVIDRVLEADGDEIEIVPGDGRARELDAAGGAAIDLTTEQLAGIAATIADDMAAMSGHRLRLPLRVGFIPGTTAYATPVVRTDGSARACRISFPTGVLGSDLGSINSTIAHEVWHCFQLDADPGGFRTGPLWLIEGQAEWAGEAYVGGSPTSAGRWDTWLLAVDRSLWRRSYDALGVFAVAAQSGADPWRAMLPMLGRGNVAAVEQLFGAPAVDAIRATASALVRAPAVGEVWESTGPGITAAQGAPILAASAGTDTEARLTVGRFATLPVVLAIPADGDIVHVRTEGGDAGAVQLPGTARFDLGAGGSLRFCLRPDGCECPGGGGPAGGDLPTASPGEGAAAVGSVTGGEVAVVVGFESLDDACTNDLVGTWTTDVSTQLSVLLAPFGGDAPSCSGPYVLTFGDDGSFSAGYTATCVIGGMSGAGTGEFRGTYVHDEATFTLADIEGSGSMTFAGVTQPIPIVDGFRAAFSRPTPYRIVDDVLTYTFEGQEFSFVRSM